MRSICVRQARLIKIQWIVILFLIVLLIVSLASRSNAAAVDTASGVPAETIQDDTSPAKTSAPAMEPASASDPGLEADSALDPESEAEPVLLGEFKLTAYCPCEKCCGKAKNDPLYGITAYGYTATAGRTIAVDPRVIPIGTEVIINGHTYVAEDVGGAIKENRIDIYFETHQEALEFGVQTALVYINQNFI